MRVRGAGREMKMGEGGGGRWREGGEEDGGGGGGRWRGGTVLTMMVRGGCLRRA